MTDLRCAYQDRTVAAYGALRDGNGEDLATVALSSYAFDRVSAQEVADRFQRLADAPCGLAGRITSWKDGATFFWRAANAVQGVGKCLISILYLCAGVLASTAHAQDPLLALTIQGPVSHVRDGDTIEVGVIPVRLQGLHAPELDEPGGREAKGAMVALTKNTFVVCRLTGETNGDRYIGRCFAMETLWDYELTDQQVDRVPLCAFFDCFNEEDRNWNFILAIDAADLATQLIKAGLGRDCPRFSGGRYVDYETEDAAARFPLPGYCEP